MVDAAVRYLEKRGLPGPWSLSAGDTTGVSQVVVIPCLAELPGLLDTLDDLARNSAAVLEETLVICVVNNRAPGFAAPGDLANNAETLAVLEARRADGPLRLGMVDAASPGKELPEKDGVGLARKLGLDHGVAVLHRNGCMDAPLINTDGDTRLKTGFLDAMRAFYAASGRWAAVVDYAHPLAGTSADAAILGYELFLRYHELGLAFAGSPYAYPTIGSTISCTARAYVTAGGMNRRQAAEDFYFLQQLAKTGKVERIHTTRVQPAARASHRVPFGTGRRVRDFEENPDDAFRLYHPESYRILRDWLEAAREGGNAAVLTARAQEIAPSLAGFLDRQGFARAWERILANSRGPQGQRRFHEWFDAFRTLKLLHHLRDEGLPRQEMFGAIGTLLALRGEAAPFALGPALRDNLDGQRALLHHLRQRAEQVAP